MALIRFSKKPYRRKLKERELIKENKRRWSSEQKERKTWKQDNKFDESPYLRKWLQIKKNSKKQIENLLLSSLGYFDGAQSASEMLSKGLGLQEILLDQKALEDLSYNIFMVKLADLTCSEKGANLKQEDRNLVMKSIIGQLFPQPALVQASNPSSKKTEALIEKIMQIKQSSE